VKALRAKYPGDVGALAPLLLNLVSLKAGEAMFLGPGEMHAYLEGTGLELMANSDNVLRGGLTPKHVDVKELLAIGRFEPNPPGVFMPTAISEHERVYKTPAPEFELSIVDAAEGAPFVPAPGRGVELLLGLEGALEVAWGERRLPLGRGRAAFVPANVMEYQIAGEGRAARAAVPTTGPR
jgi:mannose-6-phosphate isomerase